MENNKVKAWWEDFDYNLTETEHKQINRVKLILHQKIKDMKKRGKLDLLKAAKKLGDIIKYKPDI